MSQPPVEQSAALTPPCAKWFAEEVQPHEASLRSYLRRLFPRFPDVDDLVQESYARLIRAQTTGRVSYVKAFLFTTARNVALDCLRRKQVVSIESVADLAELPIEADEPDVAAAINKQDQLTLLASSVRALPDRCRQVLTLRLMYGYTPKQIAAELGITESTVKVQLAKGMRRCVQYFEERGIDPPRRSEPEVKS